MIFLKHLFIPLGLIFGVYLLLSYCYSSDTSNTPNSIITFTRRFIILVTIAISFIVISFGPFMLYEYITSNVLYDYTNILPWSHGYCESTNTCNNVIGQYGNMTMDDIKHKAIQHITQIISRLFPFGRGLVHAYWAPNIWALYCFADRVLIIIAKLLRISYPPAHGGMILPSPSSGLVGDFQFVYLPRISPLMSLACVILSMSPAVIAVILHHKKPNMLILSVVYASLCIFMFGYHVHEKAILVALLPLTLLVNSDIASSSNSKSGNKINFLFLQLSLGGTVGLLPLFYGIQESIIAGI